MCFGRPDKNRQRRKARKRRQRQQQQMAMQQQQAESQRLMMEQRVRKAEAAARAAANKPLPMADQPLQSPDFGGTTLRKKRTTGKRAGRGSRGARFSVALNMGDYRGRRGGMPNV